MSVFKTLWVTLILLFLFLLTQTFVFADAQSRNDPSALHNLSEAQAVQIAAQFCRRIGEPVTTTGKAEIITPDTTDGPTEHWQTCWKVTFRHQAELKVIDATGIVADYRNHVFSQKEINEMNQPVEPFITEVDALAKANTVRQAVGMPGELSSQPHVYQPHGYLGTNGEPIKHGGSEWLIIYPRQFQGIPYQDEGLSIGIDAESGAVTGFYLRLASPPLAHTAMTVSREQAGEVGKAAMEKAGQHDAILAIVGRKMVRPNTFAEPDGNENPLPGPARPVWTCIFHTAGFSGKSFLEVWVDMETGVVVGGAAHVSRGSNLKPSSKSAPAKPILPLVPLAKPAK